MYVKSSKLLTLLWLNVFMCCVLYIAPVCFNTTYCEEESVSDDLLSFNHCCFELFAVSFTSSGQCLLCPKIGMYVIFKMFTSDY